MKAYYTKKEKNGKESRSFVYCKLDEEFAEEILAKNFKWIRTHEQESDKKDMVPELHVTTDGAFITYCQKRLTRPSYLIIADTQKQLSELVESFGFVL